MSTLYKILQFIKALFWHILHGSPKSSKKLILERYNICLLCDQFDNTNHQCLDCGCNINDQEILMNKLAWRDQQCPRNKW